jgi:outer membrane receptor protein involved in Fe transport
LGLLIVVSCLCAARADAHETKHFSIAAGSLADALVAFASQADLSIAIDDPQLATLRTRGISGNYDVPAALKRLLRGTGYEFVFTTVSTVRLIRHEPTRAPSPHSIASPLPRQAAGSGDILVTASKQRLNLSYYPANVSILKLDSIDAIRAGSDGSSFILRHLPNLASTNLGPGRNKIFIAGIADSSFNGTSQSTISQYLGETRLIYAAPDPDLALYDVQQIEVLEGPQGTLYGAGTLGGIVKLLPRPPDQTATAATISTGIRLTQDGAPGYDAAGVLNLPLTGTLAARLVGYNAADGGYIDDRLRGLRDINRDQVSGVRATLRWTPDRTWTIDLALVGQNRSSADGQYAESDVGPLARRSAIAQPFDNDYRLASLTITRSHGATQLVSATSYTHHAIESVYDATSTPGVTAPQAFAEDVTVSLLSHEIRLSGPISANGSWIVGASLIDNRDHVDRALGTPSNPQPLSNVTNTTLDTAVFGQAAFPLAPRLSMTLGGRLAYVHQSSEFTGHSAPNGFEPTRDETRAMPTAMLSWKPKSGALAYASYTEGFRPGALELSGAVGDATAQRFEADSVRTLKLGMRFGMDRDSVLSGSFAASLTYWDNIQADLIGLNGLPYVANIGSGVVRNLAASVVWHPASDLTLQASGFLNFSELSDPAPGFGAAQDRDLPNIAEDGWRFDASRRQTVGNAVLSIDGAIRFVGHSNLAIQPPFDLPQGRYYELSVGMRLDIGRWAVTLDLENALNSQGNTFAYGNPFSVAAGLQQTPLRPRSIRMGVAASF